MEAMHYRNLILKARQLGFTSLCTILALDYAISTRNFRSCIICDTRENAQTIFRDKVLFAYDRLPTSVRGGLRALKRDAGELVLSNNSGVRVTTSARTSTVQFMHISEYGKVCVKWPEKAREIKTGALPAVHKGGICTIESTAYGQEGDYSAMCEAAAHRPQKELTELDFKLHWWPWWRHENYHLDDEIARSVALPDRLKDYFTRLAKTEGADFSQGQMAWYAAQENALGSDMLREYPSTMAEAFQAVIEGAYYRAQLDDAYEEGRVGDLAILPQVKVDTWWDIGHGDATAVWFVQHVGDWIHIVDYYECVHEGLGHYAEVLKRKGYNYGAFLAPHDIGVHDWSTGLTRQETALAEYGIPFQAVAKLGLDDGIEAVRRMLPRCKFDRQRCDRGLKALSAYRHEWDPDKGRWKSEPRHDWSSHPADSFRYGAVGRSTGVDVSKWTV